MLLKEYENILTSIISSDWNICGIKDFLNSPNRKSILLRHDVDRRPDKAILMARLEKKYGIRSTYYFRADKNGNYSSVAMRLISSLGHEIGYHYETLTECNGDFDKAVSLFKNNLKNIREIIDCQTISMHGRPFSKFNNQELFKKHDLTHFGLLGDAVLNISIYKPLYFTDVGGRWNHNSVNFRDSIPESRDASEYKSLPDDIDFILQDDVGPIYISAHPERWAEGIFDRIYCSSLDSFINVIKRIMKTIRKTSGAFKI